MEAKFVNGLIAKAPHQNAPEFVKAKLSIKRSELIQWLSEQTSDWVNVDVKVSKGGKWYAQVDEYKPEPKPAEQQQPVVHEDIEDIRLEDVPF